MSRMNKSLQQAIYSQMCNVGVSFVLLHHKPADVTINAGMSALKQRVLDQQQSTESMRSDSAHDVSQNGMPTSSTLDQTVNTAVCPNDLDLLYTLLKLPKQSESQKMAIESLTQEYSTLIEKCECEASLQVKQRTSVEPNSRAILRQASSQLHEEMEFSQAVEQVLSVLNRSLNPTSPVEVTICKRQLLLDLVEDVSASPDMAVVLLLYLVSVRLQTCFIDIPNLETPPCPSRAKEVLTTIVLLIDALFTQVSQIPEDLKTLLKSSLEEILALNGKSTMLDELTFTALTHLLFRLVK